MNLRQLKTLVLSLVLTLLLCPISPSFVAAATQQEEIVLAEGTAINVVTAEEISSKEAKPNDPVRFTVSEDVVINAQILVRKGTVAIGSVINAEKRGYLGKSGKLAIQVESTQTADGQSVKLRAAKGREGDDKTYSTAALSMISPFFLFKKGGEAKIEAGMPITVYVAEERRFRVEGSNLVAVANEITLDTGSAEEAMVFIYRPKKWMGRGLEPSVFVDGVELARMDNGRYFALKVKPGKHIVHMTSDDKGYALDMGPGHKYYFRIGIEPGMWKGHGKITLDDPERARAEIKKLKFIGKDKIKALDVVLELSPD